MSFNIPFNIPFNTLYIIMMIIFINGLCISCQPTEREVVHEKADVPVSTQINQTPLSQKSSSQVVTHEYKDQSTILAEVGPVKITQKMLDRHLEKLSPFSRSRYQNPDRLQELLESLIRFELLALAAQQAGHEKHPDVILAHKQSMVRTLLKTDLRNRVTMSDITDQEVERYYQEHKKDYHRPKQVRVAHILFKDQSHAQKILEQLQQQIRQNPTQAQALFAYQVKLHSIDLESKNRRGDLQYFTQEGQRIAEQTLPQSLPEPEVITAAFLLKAIGDLYPQIIQSKKGYHIIQKLGERRSLNRDLSTVTPEIKNILLKLKKQKVMEAYVSHLRTQSKIHIFKEQLNQVKLKAPNPQNFKKNQAIKKLMNQSL